MQYFSSLNTTPIETIFSLQYANAKKQALEYTYFKYHCVCWYCKSPKKHEVSSRYIPDIFPIYIRNLIARNLVSATAGQCASLGYDREKLARRRKLA
jgi:hypothetical protein